MYYIGCIILFPSLLATPKIESSAPNVGMLRMWYINNISSEFSISYASIIVITELNFADRKAVT